MASKPMEPGRVRFTVPAGHAGGVVALVVEAGGEISDVVRVRVQ